MTLVLETAGHVAGSHTHVLIIGVGRYPHVSDGAGPVNFMLPPLGQLKSPPVSARALADWFTGGEHHNPAAPLGSVELLLSDSAGQQYQPPDSATSYEIESATLPNIVRAFNDWEARCDTHAGNVAVFYFCGHGLQRDVPLLLPEDFAQNRNNPWQTAIDFSKTYQGMGQCLAQTQYYVVDACRNYSTSNLQDLDIGGVTLKRTNVTAHRPRTAPTLFATASGLPAFGDTGGRSRLTSALLECLRGVGAEKVSGNWIVSTSSLGESAQKLVNLANTELLPVQRQTVDPSIGEHALGSRVLHVLKTGTAPPVRVSLDCLPGEALPAALFYHERAGARVEAKEPGPWSTTIPAGVYNFGVSFTAPGYKPTFIAEEFVRPPVWPITLEV
jgi:Caspase domain